jgi:hypothetical protein
VDAFTTKIEEWVDRSGGRIRADARHQRLVAMGYMGAERTTVESTLLRRGPRRGPGGHEAADHDIVERHASTERSPAGTC